MRQTLSTLAILILVFMFSACQPEEEIIDEYVAVELTGAEYLAHFQTPSAMFLVAHEDLALGKRSGYLIDNKGNLRKLESISNTITPKSITIVPPTIDYMIKNSEVVAQVDLQVLVEQYKKISLASRAETIQRRGNPDALQNVEFYGITLGVPGATDPSCYGHGSTSSSSYYSPNYYSQFCLKTEGKNVSFINSDDAKGLAEWLHSFSESVK